VFERTKGDQTDLRIRLGSPDYKAECYIVWTGLSVVLFIE